MVPSPSPHLADIPVSATSPTRARELLGLLDAALAALDPQAAVRRALSDNPPEGERIGVLALGKAAPAMARGAAAALEGRLERCVIVSDHVEPTPEGSEFLIGSHPVPDGASLTAGRRLLEAAAEPSDHVVFLVSGGGSALAEVPAPGLTIQDLAVVYEALLRGGVPIEESNVVRSHLSAIKGGGLAAAAGVPTTTVVISDVGRRVELVASGPTLPGGSSPADAIEILERHDLSGSVPSSVVTALRTAPRPQPPPEGRLLVAGDGEMAARAVLDAARTRGLDAVVVTTELVGEAREAARRAIGDTPPGSIGILAGETTVTVRGEGRGGRNQEGALSAALHIAESPKAAVMFGTDGVDGPTDAAGAYVDGATVGGMRGAGVDPEAALADNDSHSALDAAGALIRCGPTGINVADLWLIDRR